MDLGELAAEIVARNSAARARSTDIAGRMAKALSDQRWKYFDGFIDDDTEPESDGEPQGDAGEVSGPSGEDGAVVSSGGVQLDAGRDETAGGQ